MLDDSDVQKGCFMSKIKYIYNSIVGKPMLTFEAEQQFKSVLKNFLSTNDSYMLYDDILGQILLLNIAEMRKYYSSGNYRNYTDWDYSFDDFCLSSCIEVLKSFCDYSIDKIEAEFKKHDILKSIVD